VPKKADGGKGGEEARKQAEERAEQSEALFERMRNAKGDERIKIMAEDRAQRQRQAIDDLKGQLGISDTDWAAVKPRIEAAYNLVHPPQMFGPNTGQPNTEVQQRSDQLRELLRDEKAAAEQIKSKLAAYRSAKEKVGRDLVTARQNLRQVMTLRQEALLVLNGLLD
jgi:chromosome segregation ATPase